MLVCDMMKNSALTSSHVYICDIYAVAQSQRQADISDDIS